MVLPSENLPPSPQPAPVAGPPVHDVIVPVYLRLRVSAEDDLAAEVAAVESIRRLGAIAIPGGGSACVLSVISPIVNHPNLPPG